MLKQPVTSAAVESDEKSDQKSDQKSDERSHDATDREPARSGNEPDRHGPAADDWLTSDFPALSREQAQRLRERLPPVSPWRGVAAQVVAGVVVACLWYVVTRRGEAAWSALYGAAAVVVPSMLFARGWARSMSRTSLQNPGALFLGFMFWEVVKMGFAVAMLVAAVAVVPRLEWPALLVALFVCLKVNWLALLWRGRA